MASRNVSRPTGTSTRKRNLLVRATGINGGTFRASGNTLMLINNKTGRASKGAYYLLREDLRRILLNGTVDNTVPVFYNNRFGRTVFNIQIDPGLIAVGCKRFVGKHAAALREWATVN